MKIFKGTGIYIAIVIILGIAYYYTLQIQRGRNQNTVPQQESGTAGTKGNKQSYIGEAFADSLIAREYLTGNFNPAKDSLFDEADLEYASRSGLYLRKEAYKAFIKMYMAASADGISLKIISATRNFNYQKGIWESKWNGSKPVDGKNLALTVKDPTERARIILKYSSMPGTSRHHWGTDIDINSMDPKYFEGEKGRKEYDWLKKHAMDYGFCQPYTEIGPLRKTGYEEEKWHWSYMPLSSAYMKAYSKKISYSDIKGFSGCETAATLKVIENYVFSVNADCN